MTKNEIIEILIKENADACWTSENLKNILSRYNMKGWSVLNGRSLVITDHSAKAIYQHSIKRYLENK